MFLLVGKCAKACRCLGYRYFGDRFSIQTSNAFVLQPEAERQQERVLSQGKKKITYTRKQKKPDFLIYIWRGFLEFHELFKERCFLKYYLFSTIGNSVLNLNGTNQFNNHHTAIYRKVKRLFSKLTRKTRTQNSTLYTTTTKAHCPACSFYFEGQIFSKSSKKLLFKR